MYLPQGDRLADFVIPDQLRTIQLVSPPLALLVDGIQGSVQPRFEFRRIPGFDDPCDYLDRGFVDDVGKVFLSIRGQKLSPRTKCVQFGIPSFDGIPIDPRVFGIRQNQNDVRGGIPPLRPRIVPYGTNRLG